MKKFISILLVFVIALSCVVFAEATTEEDLLPKWEEITTAYSEISVSPGADSTEMRFCWMAPLFSDNIFYYGISEDLSAKKAVAVDESITFFAKKECNVTLKNLSENTVYYYRYSINGELSDIYSFKTDSKDKAFTAMFVSDSQIGRSGEWEETAVQRHDTAGWYTTLEEALETNPDISVCLSTGDQVQNAGASILYNLFLAPDTLRSLPIATTAGNHELGSPYLDYHFNNPNEFSKNILPSVTAKPYYFCKGNALFIVLDTNTTVMLDHEALIDEAIHAYPDTRWRVAMMHHGVYSCADAKDENPHNRETLVPLFEKYNIDLVLSGHSHMYSRTHVMKNFEKAENGIVYIEGGCASGSNCVLTPETLPDYAAVGNRIKEPVYTVLTFSENEIGIKAYVVEDGDSKQIDESTVVYDGRDDSGAEMTTGRRFLHSLLSIPGRIISWFM